MEFSKNLHTLLWAKQLWDLPHPQMPAVRFTTSEKDSGEFFPGNTKHSLQKSHRSISPNDKSVPTQRASKPSIGASLLNIYWLSENVKRQSETQKSIPKLTEKFTKEKAKMI